MDISAVWGDLQGMDFVRRQSAEAEKHGHYTDWELLMQPKCVPGVGDNAKACAHQACVPGCLEDGALIKYYAPVAVIVRRFRPNVALTLCPR